MQQVGKQQQQNAEINCKLMRIQKHLKRPV